MTNIEFKDNLQQLYDPTTGACKWLGCTKNFKRPDEFLHHIVTDHIQSTRSECEVLVQEGLVKRAKDHLRQESERLEAMKNLVGKLRRSDTTFSEGSVIFNFWENILSQSKAQSASISPQGYQQNPTISKILPALGNLPSKYKGFTTDPLTLKTAEHNVAAKPAKTYAELIREAIISSPNQQLTLNEIYTYFESNYDYYKTNQQTWKNAIRHNLSLHKCFNRKEILKGSVWTVDEEQYSKRQTKGARYSSDAPVSKIYADVSVNCTVDCEADPVKCPMLKEKLIEEIRAQKNSVLAVRDENKVHSMDVDESEDKISSCRQENSVIVTVSQDNDQYATISSLHKELGKAM